MGNASFCDYEHRWCEKYSWKVRVGEVGGSSVSVLVLVQAELPRRVRVCVCGGNLPCCPSSLTYCPTEPGVRSEVTARTCTTTGQRIPQSITCT